MTDVRLGPALRVDGEVEVGGDKSISHRALLLGALARGRSYVGNLSPAADVSATLACLQACGGSVRPFGEGRVALEGAGAGRSLRTPPTVLDCANSGTTMRLLAAALAGHDCEAVLDGDGSLRRRPMGRVAQPLTEMGAAVETSAAGTAPLRVRGSPALRGIEYRPPVASAQLKSAVLLAGLSATGTTTVVEPVPTRDHTERMLRMCGADIAVGHGRVVLRAGDLSPFGMRIPGDLSTAAFFLALAAARPGWRVRCRSVTLNPGRTGVLEVLRGLGAEVVTEKGEAAGGVEPTGDVEVRGGRLQAMRIGGPLIPRVIDELPVLAVLATQAEGTSEIRDAGELRVKESDRIARVADGLRALGAACEELPDGLVISGPVSLRGARLDAGGDHRLAMAWSVAACLVPAGGGETMVAGADAAAVSCPGFLDDLAGLVRA